MNLSITDLKKGTVIDLDGQPYKVTDYSQKVIGRGGSIVSLRVKSLLNGKVLDKTFRGSETLTSAVVSSQPVQYLYANAGHYFFMNQTTFDQFELTNDLIGQARDYIREGDLVNLVLYNNQPISLDLPKNVKLKVTQAETAVKGDTSTALTKNIALETGLSLKAPAFIKVGDIVSVDTASGTYRERVKN